MSSVRINLPLTDLHCQGTLALTVAVILILLLPTTTRIFNTERSTLSLKKASALTVHLSTTILSDVYSIGSWFSPVHLSLKT